MAVNLMVACRLAQVRMEQTLPWIGWMIVSFVVATLPVLFIPELALWLPRRLGY
jgi:TRAP-type C4-dicarboxylate transport system permease large subunit